MWDIFASGGLVNPLEAIEQITYLMFIHDLDDSDNLRAKESAILGLFYQSIFADEVICDPACGTSGFLVASGEYLKEKRRYSMTDRKKTTT